MNAQPLSVAPLRQQLGQAFQYLQQDRLEEARQSADRLLAVHPTHPEVLYLASQVQLAAGAPEAALPLLEAAVAGVPQGPARLSLLAEQLNVLLLLRRRVAARALVDHAETLAGGHPQALWQVGLMHSHCDAPQRARDVLERARAAGCEEPALLYVLATACMYLGDFEAAESVLAALLSKAPRHGLALHLRATLRRQTPAHNHVEDLQARLAAGFPGDDARAACLFALAKELEDLGQSQAAFAALREGAALKRRTLQYDLAGELGAMSALAQTWTAEVLEAPVLGASAAAPIFIVGMPRTGTTLVERMLGCHSEVESAGELMDFSRLVADGIRRQLAAQPALTPAQAALALDYAALGQEYHRGASEAVPGATRYVDKMPVNFLYCGLIRRALPNARIIHLVRDPMDSCYAVYKTLFNSAYYFSYDLDELGDYYAGYRRLMQHWHNVMPGAILDVRYEDLVSDTATEARRILAFCGLDWQPQVLAPEDNTAPSTTASAAQVRSAVHTASVAKWRQYAAELAPLAERLRGHGVLTD